MNAEIEKIPNIDVVKAESLEDDLFAVYSQLFPGAVKSDLKFEELIGGYLNNSTMRLEFFLKPFQTISNHLKPDRPLAGWTVCSAAPNDHRSAACWPRR